MTILGHGNVGIGNTAPNNLLEVAGGAFSFRNVGLGWTAAGFDYYATSDTLRIRTNIGGLNLNTTPVVIHRLSGKVGIATTAPSSRLQVVGNASVGYGGQTGAPSNGLLVNGNTGIGTTSPGSRLQVSGNAAIGYSSATAGPVNGLAVSGNLGIGSTAPGYKLDVVGDINTSTCVRIAGTQQLGTCASDERFKKNITPISGALGKLRLLSPVHYEFRTEDYPSRNFSREVEAGLIAQELERVFPHHVVTDDDGYKRVRYGLDLNMQTIAAVKELALENDQLRAETARLRSRADRAEAEVTNLKARGDKLEAESAALRAFLCEQYPSAPMCAP